MPAVSLAQSLLLPDLRLLQVRFPRHSGLIELHVEKTSAHEVCPRCATCCKAVYDRRWATVRDAPLRNKHVVMRIRKRRFSCRTCRKPFTEPVRGIRKGARSTERYRKMLLWACETYADLKAVRQHFRCSAGYLYNALYVELERRQRMHRRDWPSIVGIDEHFFKRDHRTGFRQFVTMVVDYKGRRLLELVEGKSKGVLTYALAHIEGRHNVRYVVLDMSDTFKSFARDFFPYAQLVADKFHVLRLLHPALNRRRKEVTGDRRNLRVRRLLLKSSKRLDPRSRWALWQWLDKHPAIREVYTYKEALHRLYRTRGYMRARRAFVKLIDRMANSKLPEIQTLRKTLLRWGEQVLNYFKKPITNGRVEGLNNKAKVVKRRGYGYKSFRNYRLRLLNACAQKGNPLPPTIN